MHPHILFLFFGRRPWEVAIAQFHDKAKNSPANENVNRKGNAEAPDDQSQEEGEARNVNISLCSEQIGAVLLPGASKVIIFIFFYL